MLRMPDHSGFRAALLAGVVVAATACGGAPSRPKLDPGGPALGKSSTAKGRQKDLNVRRDPRVALAIVDPDNPYRYLEIRGRVVEITEEGADAHIDKMAKKYLGVDKYPYRQPSETRVIYKIQPEHTTMMG